MIDRILAKAAHEGLTEDEKTTLTQLLKDKHSDLNILVLRQGNGEANEMELQ